MKTAAELTTEMRRIRERARELSGFWISELAAATSALEWVLEKRPAPPSADIGSPSSVQGKLSESLTKAVEREGVGKKRKSGVSKGLRRVK